MKMKYGEILVKLLVNIFNLFLALLLRLETSFRSFFDFKKCNVRKFANLW